MKPTALSTLILVAGLAVWAPIGANTIDATSGASLHVVQGTTTSTTAMFQWQETRPNGHLCHYWDTTYTDWRSMRDSVCWSYYAVQTSTGWIVRPRQNTDTLRNLLPGRTYHYVLQGFYPPQADGSFPEVPEYATAGTFTTSGSASLRKPSPSVANAFPRWDPLGRIGGTKWAATAQGVEVQPTAGGSP